MRNAVVVTVMTGVLVVGAAGCAKRSATPETATQTAMAAAPADSKLGGVKPGMTQIEVVELIGAPGDERWYPTGKQWIPWYFGPDRSRTAYYYEAEGRVIFTGQGPTSRVHHVEYDPSEDGKR